MMDPRAWLGLFVGAVASLGASPPVPLAPACTNALAVLQDYRASWHARPLGEVVWGNLMEERRRLTVSEGAWRVVDLGADGCAVEYRVTVGATPHTLRWAITPQGAVQAADPTTRRYSGW